MLITVGILGGGFMGGMTYPRAIRTANQIMAPHGVSFELKHQWIRDPAKHAAAAAQSQITGVTADFDAVVDGSDVVFNCLPNDAHDKTITVLERGKHAVCEKPLGLDLPMAVAINEAASKSPDLHTLVSTCYVGADAVSTGREIVQGGGVIADCDTPWVNGRFSFLQDYRINDGSNWRFDFGVTGPGGILDDLVQHCLSIAFGWMGDKMRLIAVKADLQYAEGTRGGITFVDGTDPSAKTRAVDAAVVTLKFEGGSQLIFEASRFARGHKAFSWAELNGDNGSVQWELQNGQWLNRFDYNGDGHKGWTGIHCSNGEQGNVLSVGGLTQGYETYFANLFAWYGMGIAQGTQTPTFALGGRDVTPFVPRFSFGLFLQRITAAALTSGYDGGTWVEVDF